MEARYDLARNTIGVLTIVTLIALTIWVLQPFLASAIWAAMIVIATWPVMTRVQHWLWRSRAAATTVMTLALFLLLVVPLTLVIATIAANADGLVAWAAPLNSFTMPAPPEWLTRVPVVGAPIVEAGAVSRTVAWRISRPRCTLCRRGDRLAGEHDEGLRAADAAAPADRCYRWGDVRKGRACR